MLYFIPPMPNFDPAKHQVTLSMANVVVDVNKASNVRFVGLSLLHSRGIAFRAQSVSRISVDNCTLGEAGSSAMLLDTRAGPLEPAPSWVTNSTFRAIGGAAATILAGDTQTLRPGDVTFSDNLLHD